MSCPKTESRGKLFWKVAFANHLMKLDFKPPDKTTATYNQRVVSLDSCIPLDLTFGKNTMETMVYVKIETTEQLL